MKTRNHITIFCLTASMLLSGCSDWLDVKPADKNLEKEQFATVEGIYNVLNGFYLSMASEHLYGGKLTMTDIEHLAHYYYSPTDILGLENYRLFYDLQRYDYESTEVEPRFSSIWTEMYSLILQINKFIDNMKNDDVLTDDNRKIVVGEAYGLRAFLHFDLFRLFGTIPSLDMTSETIPYNTSGIMQMHPYLSGNDFLNKIMADIDTCKSYLVNDPIIERGIVRFESLSALPDVEKFNICLRNKRMNILAAEAFEARVQQYFGYVDEAALLAQSVITKMDGIISWSNLSTFAASDNYIFYPEILFSIESPKLHSRWTSYVANSDASKTYAVITAHAVKNIFASEDDDFNRTTDVRSRQWSVNMDLGSAYYVSKKFNSHSFAGTTVESTKEQLASMINYTQPLMRMSELYYMIAEAHIKNDQLTLAIPVLNEVSAKRGKIQQEELPLTTSREALVDFLEREYYREFYGEGQVFYFLKRNMKTSLFRTSGAVGRGFVMDLKNYVVPIPLNEQNS